MNRADFIALTAGGQFDRHAERMAPGNTLNLKGAFTRQVKQNPQGIVRVELRWWEGSKLLQRRSFSYGLGTSLAVVDDYPITQELADRCDRGELEVAIFRAPACERTPPTFKGNAWHRPNREALDLFFGVATMLVSPGPTVRSKVPVDGGANG